MANTTRNNKNRQGQVDIKMNSSELQKRFYTTYKEFFNTHDIVLSGNSVLTWWADISHGVSALRIKQKLPVKIYCGANYNNSGKITFGKMLSYTILDDVFIENSVNTFFTHDIDEVSGFLENFLLRHGCHLWVDISLLFETPPGHGLAFSGVVSVLLTFLTHMLTGQLDTKTLVGWEFFMESSLFDEIYTSSLLLSNCIWGGKGISGSSNCVVMTSGLALPMVHLSQKCTHTDMHENIIDEGTNDIHRCFNTILYKDSLLNFLWKDDTTINELPIDYGVIFTGVGYRFADIEATREQRQYEEDKLKSFITNTVASLSIPVANQAKISAILSFDQNEVIYKNIDHMNLKILEGFNSLFRGIRTDSSMETFIDTIRKIGLSSFAYQKENKVLAALQYLFHQYQGFDDEAIGVLPFNTGRIGGSLFFVMKKERSRTTINKVLKQLRADGHIASLDYASWRDWYSSDGVRVEQYISEQIYSDYTREWDVLFTDSFGRSYSGDYDTMIQNETDGILLDTIGGRIYLQGTKLTSKEIHSQNTTINMLKLLLGNIGKEVLNSRLPSSTYSHNKNELLSKIILPIKKITKEHFGQEVSLTCSGWITEYYLRLDRDESIRIGIIKKLQH